MPCSAFMQNRPLYFLAGCCQWQLNQSFLVTAGPHCLQCDHCISYERVHLSVCPSVTCWYCVETNEATIMQFSLSGSKIILVAGEVKIAGKFAGDDP